jgi:hypothetical protein
MEYKVGIDRVHINDEEENFPYPLKLWYDANYIYVKVIKLPPIGYSSMRVCLEVSTPLRCHKQGTLKNTYRNKQHNSKGGKFYVTDYYLYHHEEYNKQLDEWEDTSGNIPRLLTKDDEGIVFRYPITIEGADIKIRDLYMKYLDQSQIASHDITYLYHYVRGTFRAHINNNSAGQRLTQEFFPKQYWNNYYSNITKIDLI